VVCRGDLQATQTARRLQVGPWAAVDVPVLDQNNIELLNLLGNGELVVNKGAVYFVFVPLVQEVAKIGRPKVANLSHNLVQWFQYQTHTPSL